MTIRPIQTPADHAAAVARLGELWRAQPGSDEFAELDALATLIDAYESKLVVIPAAQPVDVLKYAITDMGHSQAEFARLIGSRSRASEVLSGKRALTLNMVRVISKAWHIPAQLLIGEDDVSRRKAATPRRAAGSVKVKKLRGAVDRSVA